MASSTENTNNFTWGKGSLPSIIHLKPSLPQILGKSIVWIEDIRKAPSGNQCNLGNYSLSNSTLTITIQAVASDLFSLYIEKDERSKKLIGGILLDSSKRESNDQVTWHEVSFSFHFEDAMNFSSINTLSPKNSCIILSKWPKVTYSISITPSLKKDKHSYFIYDGFFEKNKLSLMLEYSFSTTEFKLEIDKESLKNKELKAELFAIESHKSQDCLCSRKGRSTSTIKFDLKHFDLDHIDYISIFGPHDTQVLGEKELCISTKYLSNHEI